MSDPELIKEAKLWVRIRTPAVDDEVGQIIDACILDLKNAGVQKTDTADPLIRQAMKLYLKAQFGYDDESEKYNRAYEHLKASLALSGDYRGGGYRWIESEQSI